MSRQAVTTNHDREKCHRKRHRPFSLGSLVDHFRAGDASSVAVGVATQGVLVPVLLAPAAAAAGVVRVKRRGALASTAGAAAATAHAQEATHGQLMCTRVRVMVACEAPAISCYGAWCYDAMLRANWFLNVRAPSK